LPEAFHIVEYEDVDDSSCYGIAVNCSLCLGQLAVFSITGQGLAVGDFNFWSLTQYTACSAAEREPGDHCFWNQDSMASDDTIETLNHASRTEQSLVEAHGQNLARTLAELPEISRRSQDLTRFHLAKGAWSLAAPKTSR
jgi:hypothetical protein